MLANHPNVLGRGPTASSIGIGDVDGPSSSTDKAIARFDGTTGKIIQNSTVTLSDTTGVFTQTTTNGGFALTPNGTGMTSFVGASQTSWVGSVPAAATFGGLWLAQGTPTAANASLTSSGSTLQINVPTTGDRIDFTAAGTLRARIAVTTGNLLLGGLTTDGTGVLQFPAATTSAGGIAFGTDLFLFRSGAGNMSIGSGRWIGNGMTVNTTSTISFGATAAATIGVSADTTAGNMVFTNTATGFTQILQASGASFAAKFNHVGGTNPVVQLTENGTSSSQWASNAGNVFIDSMGSGKVINLRSDNQALSLTISGGAAATLTGGAGNMTIVSGTGNSREMAFQTTTSGGTATTFLSADNSQNVTLKDTANLLWSGRTKLSAAADGYLALLNNAGSGFTMLRFGGDSTSFAGIKRESAELGVKLADDSGYTYIKTKLRASNGTAGANFSGVPLTITVVDGVVTAVA